MQNYTCPIVPCALPQLVSLVTFLSIRFYLLVSGLTVFSQLPALEQNIQKAVMFYFLPILSKPWGRKTA